MILSSERPFDLVHTQERRLGRPNAYMDQSRLLFVSILRLILRLADGSSSSSGSSNFYALPGRDVSFAFVRHGRVDDVH